MCWLHKLFEGCETWEKSEEDIFRLEDLEEVAELMRRQFVVPVKLDIDGE